MVLNKSSQASDSSFLDCIRNKYQEPEVIQYPKGLSHFLAVQRGDNCKTLRNPDRLTAEVTTSNDRSI